MSRASRRSVAAALLVLAALSAACASFRPPAAFDSSPVRERSVTTVQDGMRVSAARLRRREVEPVFGVELSRKQIEPVWLEIENRTEQPVLFLLTGLDPEYFSPIEVGHAFRAGFGSEANARREAHIAELALDSRTAIEPGTTRSGFVYTNPSVGTKVVDVDFLGAEWMASLTLFLPDPDDPAARERVTLFQRPVPGEELVEEEAALRAAVEALPCCSTNAEGEHVAPFNGVVIGSLDQWVSAVLRRGYRYRELSPLFAFGRAQDAAAAKNAQWIDAQPHAARFWRTPLSYRGRPVWLLQVCSPRGGRFALHPDEIEPRADHARNHVVQDLFYSQALGELGFTPGAGCARSAAAGVTTDGLRAVMVFEDRAIALDEIQFFDWEQLVTAD